MPTILAQNLLRSAHTTSARDRHVSIVAHLAALPGDEMAIVPVGSNEEHSYMDDKQPMVFEDLHVGEEYADEYVLTPELVRDYAEGIDDAHPWYIEHSPFGGPVAHPILIVAQHARLFKTKYVTAGNVHTRHETQFLNPARIGKVIKMYGKLVEKYLKRGREYLVMECRSVDENGIEICRDRRTIITHYAKRPE